MWKWLLLVVVAFIPSSPRCEGGKATWSSPRPKLLNALHELIGNDPGHGPRPQKRSYRRALRRAQIHGGTWYRNNWITSSTYVTTKPTMRLPPPPRRLPKTKPRLRLLSWNTWSLTQELWQEIQDYGLAHNFDVIFLQSTCWTFSNTWMTSNFHIIHSGNEKDRHCGLLMMISKRLCEPKDISHSALVAGRLQHVRVRLPEHGLDLFNVYQHPWRPTDTKELNMKNREQVWTALHQSLTKVPFRNQLLIAGDFNSSLLTETNPDEPQFRQLIRHHHLGSLLQSNPTQKTYFAPQGSSQIDYLFSRQCQLDSQAKQGWVEKQCPLGGWRSNLDHRPLISSYPKQWQPWRRKPAAIQSAWQIREHLANMQKHSPEEWDALCTDLGTTLQSLPQTLDQIETIHQHIVPKLPMARTNSTSAAGLATGGLTRQMWMCHKELIRPKLVTLRHILSKWHMWTKVQDLRKKLRKQCRQHKRDKLAAQITAAAQAFRQRDPYRMYKIINQLAPKAPFRAVHPRSEHGLAQDPECELREITRFFRQLCDSSQWTFQAPALDRMPFSQQELENALSRVPKTKSVAPSTSPGHVISGLAPMLAPWLYDTLSKLWTQNTTLTIPHLWQDAWVTCLPKRSVSSPKDLRPIALQCAIGKAVLRVIVRHALKETHHQFLPWPIFAYLRGRSTEHALLRVHQHLRDVRDQCQSCVHNIWHRKAKQIPPRCRGGVTLSLDLSNAFDSVDRSQIAKGMQVVGLSEVYQRLLLSWLSPVHYHLQHKGLTSSIPVTRGIRQGCVASPYLWLLWTISFLDELLLSRSYEWICQHLSIYADDLISQWIVETIEQFQDVLVDIGLLLDLFEAMSLQVSLTKSVVLLRLTGTNSHALHKRHCCWSNGTYCLKIPRHHKPHSLLPIVKSHKYLGSILTYVNPEDATLNYRLKCGRQAFFRLIKFLGRSGQTGKTFKIQLWQQCILTSYVYALFPCGLTRTGCYRFESTVYQDLRRLANNWSHITHVSNLDLASSLKIEPPLDYLQVRWQEHAEKHAIAGEQMHPFDLLTSIDVASHWQSLYIQIASAACDRPLKNRTTTEPNWPCPHCPKTFHLREVMRRHIVTVHPELDQAPEFVITRDAKNGMPHCRHCDKKLSSRSTLRQHIEHQWCTNFDPHLQEIELLCHQPQIRQRILDGRWETLLADRPLNRELTSHCCLCGTWYGHLTSLAAHIKKAHGDLLTASLQSRAEIDQHVRWGAHCHICEQQVNKTHKCPVPMQLALLKHHLQAEPAALRPESVHVLPPPARRRSPFDGAYGKDEIQPLFDASRDCRGGYDICNHCGGSFKDHVGLRRHIEYQRCQKFDSTKPPQAWILKYQPAVHELFQIVHPESWLYDRDFLYRLKLECALCGRLFARTALLAEHLAADHRNSWMDAQPYAKHLLDHYQPLGEACMCGVWVQPSCDSHHCAVATQLGILRQLVRRNTEPPTLGSLPNLLDEWLMDEDYGQAWSHPEYAYFFGNYCGLCLNRAMNLEDLWHHFEEHHSHMMPAAIAHLDQVLATRQACCMACGTLSAQAKRSTPRCPYALNSILCQQLRHGLPHARGRERSPRRTHGRLSALGPSPAREGTIYHGSSSNWLEEAQGRSGGIRNRRSSTAMHSDVETPVEARGLHQRLVPRPELGAVPGQARTRSNSEGADCHQNLARDSESRPVPAPLAEHRSVWPSSKRCTLVSFDYRRRNQEMQYGSTQYRVISSQRE